jgi:hypothetical protein
LFEGIFPSQTPISRGVLRVKQANPLRTKPVYIHESESVRKLVDQGIQGVLDSDPKGWPSPEEVARAIIEQVFDEMRPKLQGEVRELFLNSLRYISGRPTSIQAERNANNGNNHQTGNEEQPYATD